MSLFETAKAAAAGSWIGTWACAQQLTETANLPPRPGLAGNTLRQAVRLTLGGGRLRLRFSNAYGESPLAIKSVHLAVSKGGGSVYPETDAELTFQSSPSVSVPAGRDAVSDPLLFDASPLGDLAVSVHFGAVPHAVTGHPGSRTTSYIRSGDAGSAGGFDGAASTEHWYILSGIEVWAEGPCAALVALGDSITDGRGSTTNGNDRWPDNLARRLREGADTKGIAVLNQGIGGNAVVSGGLGPTALERFDRDVLTQSGVRWLIVLEGVNDIGSGDARNAANALISAYGSFISKAHGKGILVYGVPILPFGGSFYDGPGRESARERVNGWIRTSGGFDEVIDLDAAVRDPENPMKLLPDYDSGDHLHLNAAGYGRMADSIDLGLFRRD